MCLSSRLSTSLCCVIAPLSFRSIVLASWYVAQTFALANGRRCCRIYCLDEGVTSEEEGERRGHDQRMDKAKQMIKQLELTDQRIVRTLEEKMSFFRALAESAGRGSHVGRFSGIINTLYEFTFS